MRKGLDRIGVNISVASAHRACLDKKKFKTRNAARDFGKRGQKEHGNAPTTPYRCNVCDGWHLTTLSREDGNAASRRQWIKPLAPGKG